MKTRDYMATAQGKCACKDSCILVLFCMCDQQKVGFDMGNLPEWADDATALAEWWKISRPYFNTTVWAVTYVQGWCAEEKV